MAMVAHTVRCRGCKPVRSNEADFTAGYSTDGEIGVDTNRRSTDPKWTQNQEVAFADGFPALIVTQVCRHGGQAIYSRVQLQHCRNFMLTIKHCIPAFCGIARNSFADAASTHVHTMEKLHLLFVAGNQAGVSKVCCRLTPAILH